MLLINIYLLLFYLYSAFIFLTRKHLENCSNTLFVPFLGHCDVYDVIYAFNLFNFKLYLSNLLNVVSYLLNLLFIVFNDSLLVM